MGAKRTYPDAKTRKLTLLSGAHTALGTVRLGLLDLDISGVARDKVLGLVDGELVRVTAAIRIAKGIDPISGKRLRT